MSLPATATRYRRRFRRGSSHRRALRGLVSLIFALALVDIDGAHSLASAASAPNPPAVPAQAAQAGQAALFALPPESRPMPASVPVSSVPVPPAPIAAPVAPAPAENAAGRVPPAPAVPAVRGPVRSSASDGSGPDPDTPTAPNGYGCGPALAYLAANAAPGFTFQCPGDSYGNQAMTCVNHAPECPGQRIIAITVPCPAAYENEASNSWVVLGLRGGAIDPYGHCS